MVEREGVVHVGKLRPVKAGGCAERATEGFELGRDFSSGGGVSETGTGDNAGNGGWAGRAAAMRRCVGQLTVLGIAAKRRRATVVGRRHLHIGILDSAQVHGRGCVQKKTGKVVEVQRD